MQPLSQDKQSSKRQSADTLGESSQLKKVKRSKSSCKSVNLVLGSSNSCYDLRSLVVAQDDAQHVICLLEETLSSAADEGKKSTAATASSSSTGTASASSPTAPSSSSSSSGVKRLLYFGVNETVKAVASAKCQLIALTNPSSTHLQFALIDVCREARVPLILVPDLCRLQVPGISRITAIGVRSDAHHTHPIVQALTKLVTPHARKIFSDETDDSSCHLADVSTSKLDSSSASITDSFESVVASLKSQGKGQTASKRKRDKKKPK